VCFRLIGISYEASPVMQFLQDLKTVRMAYFCSMDSFIVPNQQCHSTEVQLSTEILKP